MATRRFIGPHGARFAWDEPLPGWLEQQIARGEIVEDDGRQNPKRRVRAAHGLAPAPADGTSFCLVTAAWGRYQITDLVLRQWRNASGTLASRGITVNAVLVADDDNLEIATRHGFDTVELGNSDVGAKFNAGFARALAHQPDHVVHIGSDDWIHPDFFTVVPNQRSILTGSLIQVVDVPTGRMRAASIDTAVGAIPWVIPAWMIARADGNVIEPGLQKGFDGALIRGLTRAVGSPPSWQFHDPNEFARVGFSIPSVNITPFDALKREQTGPDLTLEALRGFYPDSLIDAALEVAA